MALPQIPSKLGTEWSRGVYLPDTLCIFFSLLLSYTLSQSQDGIYLCTRSDRSLFSLACLQAKTKVWRLLIRELLFTDDAALTPHTEETLQWLITCFTCTCREFSLTISLKNTNIIGQDLSRISIGDCILEVVEDFTYLGSTISSNLSLDAKLNTWSARQWQQWLALQRGSGKTPCWPSTPRWRCINPACSACCSMAVKHGLCTPSKIADSMPSTYTALEGFWASPGKTLSQTRTSWLRWEYQACLPCLPEDTCTGLMSATFTMAKPQGCAVWWACHWLQTCRKACSLLQRCL